MECVYVGLGFALHTYYHLEVQGNDFHLRETESTYVILRILIGVRRFLVEGLLS